ncbi:hypothetical protein ACFFX0_30715 [Citricoccus parietis]|uniref:Uncharacterized protein n=1 Tax=Citricoccus parietis TaxID=592307 RepID=A0ABV5G8N5_9MICC
MIVHAMFRREHSPVNADRRPVRPQSGAQRYRYTEADPVRGGGYPIPGGSPSGGLQTTPAGNWSRPAAALTQRTSSTRPPRAPPPSVP